MNAMLQTPGARPCSPRCPPAPCPPTRPPAGKEANVYHATGGKAPDGACTAELAIKVYKTAILVFKDRDR